jgi:hypothetical protein
VFAGAAERARVRDVTPHGLRHTAASLAIAAGATVVLLQRMLRHSSPTVTLIVYAHLFADDLDTVADRLHAAKIKASADLARTCGPVTALRGGPNRGQHDLRFSWSVGSSPDNGGT